MLKVFLILSLLTAGSIASAASTAEDAKFGMQLVKEVHDSASSTLSTEDKKKLELAFEKFQIIEARQDSAVQTCKIVAMKHGDLPKTVNQICDGVQSHNLACVLRAIADGYLPDNILEMCEK